MTETNPTKGHRQKLREQFLSGDESATHQDVLLELLLTYAMPRKDVRPLAQKLIAEFGGLSAILSASPKMLCKIKGIGEVTAAFIKIIDWLRIHYPARKPEVAESLEQQMSLFTESEKVSPDKPVIEEAESEEKPQKKRSGLFSKTVLKEAIDLLPGLPDTDAIDDAKKYFRENLHYSAESTRHRYTSYIISRMFPNGKADVALRNFAKKFKGDRNLIEVCFYRFMKAEPLLEDVIHEILLPQIGAGQVKRQKIKQYLTDRFPGYKSIGDCTNGMIDALTSGGVVRAERLTLTFSYRDIPLPAFAFILHSEFPNPGMFDLSKAEENPTFKAMLWHPDRMLKMIYELRNQGLISKVSEIDSVRQFTTKWSLDDVVKKLCHS